MSTTTVGSGGLLGRHASHWIFRRLIQRPSWQGERENRRHRDGSRDRVTLAIYLLIPPLVAANAVGMPRDHQVLVGRNDADLAA